MIEKTTQMPDKNFPVGYVDFVGAGPGGSQLITLAGKQAIAEADVILTDALVSPILLTHARWDAEIFDVGKHGGQHQWTQEQIGILLKQKALAGKRIARLKGGDPGTFGRLAEELDVLTAHNIPFQIIAGVTAVSATAASIGITLTDRDSAPSLTLLTGHRRQDGTLPTMNWSWITQSGTVACYMGIAQAQTTSQALLEAGMAPTTPVAIVRWATTWKQESWQSTLGTLADDLVKFAVRPPATWIVGQVAQNPQHHLPKAKGMIGLFRPFGSNDDLEKELIKDGWEVFSLALQKPIAQTDSKILRELNFLNTTWLAFTSPTAVKYLPLLLKHASRDLRQLAAANIAAVGTATAQALTDIGLHADIIAQGRRGADDLVTKLLHTTTPGEIIFFQSALARPEPKQHLQDAGWDVTHIATHTLEQRPTYPAALDFAISRGWLTHAIWTGSSQIELAITPETLLAWQKIQHLAIGEHTAATLEKKGLATKIASQSTSEALLTLIRG